jgi:predicted nuclease of predicted toxin-antitoxin system
VVTTGNISRSELVGLIERHLPEVVSALTSHTLVEIDRSMVKPIR